MWPEPFSAEGKSVGVELLSHGHADDLAEAAADGDLHGCGTPRCRNPTAWAPKSTGASA